MHEECVIAVSVQRGHGTSQAQGYESQREAAVEIRPHIARLIGNDENGIVVGIVGFIELFSGTLLLLRNLLRS